MRSLRVGRRAVALIAATYVYFLIFAQFGFLKRLAELGLADAHLKQLMGAMAAGGIAASLLAARTVGRVSPVTALRAALVGCGLAAAATALPLTLAGAAGIACLIGVSLGLLTVTLVANLGVWTGAGAPLIGAGLGTGLGYFICNIPAVFTASPAHMGLFAAGVCAAAFAAAGPAREQAVASVEGAAPAFPLLLVWFTALIWFDSAAFFIIQNSPALKGGTWGGAAHLWRNGALHLGAALASAALLRRWGLAPVLLAAFVCLAGASLLLLDPALTGPASLLYPVGVSFYSVALVVYPSFLLRAGSARERTGKAGLIYAVAGWAGSALGIGMAQNLHRVPPGFVGGAALLFLLQLGLRYRREAAAVAGVAATALLLARLAPKPAAAQTAEARGKQVYIAEGCIHCHSQYVRPRTADTLLWGPPADLEAVRKQQPPLIGNRRQGPDLGEVGARRSPLWLRMHLVDPRVVSPASIMPAYGALFQGSPKGEDLLAYLASLHSPDSRAHVRAVAAAWQPRATQPLPNGAALFTRYCATCHAPQGRARAEWGGSFHRLPPLLAGRTWAPASVPRLERLVKFGLPGADMPGREYLPDGSVEAIARYVAGGAR